MHHMEFIDAGYRVMSIFNVDASGQCECGRPDCHIDNPKSIVFKHPRVGQWVITPEWDEDQLATMHEMNQFKTGYGVLMRNDLVVIDVDARNGGVESYGRFVEDFPSVASCGLIVQTGSGGGSRHLYFKAPKNIALQRHLKEYPGLDFQAGNCFVIGPGSKHRSGNRYEIIHGSVGDIFELPSDITEALKKPDRVRTEYNGGNVDVSSDLIQDILDHIPPAEDYETWLTVGMAIHHSMDGDGVSLWDRWSARAKNYDDQLVHTKWATFGRASIPVTLGTLVHMAESNGWKWPVTFDGELELIESHSGSSGIDLRRPPGFVGEVAKWINEQCMYPRENLAVMCALVAVGVMGGLRRVDKRTEVTSNLMAFCVAGSATGKDAVLSAMQDLFIAAGMGRTLNGRLKSDTEILRSLIEHQSATYVIDEIGMELRKIVSAGKKGGTPYLEGMIPTIMSVFTKSNGRLLLGGDETREIRKSITSEIAAINKAMDKEGETPALVAMMDNAKMRLDSLDQGLFRPFLSMVGFTTPETFEAVMDRDMATNGFIGRCIIVQEKDDNPWPKKGFKRTPMPDHIANTLRALAVGDEYDMQAKRIEFNGERIRVPYTEEADKRIDEIQTYFLEKAAEMGERNGLIPLARRAPLMVEKISFILAMADGVRTLEHVNWAFEFVNRDLNTKVNMVVSQDDGGKTFDALRARLETILEEDRGTSFGVIKHKLKTYKPEDIIKCLERMGARKEVDEHPKNKKTIEKWFLC